MSGTNVGNCQFTVWYSQAGAEAGRENPDGSELYRKVAAHQIEHHKQLIRGNFEKEARSSKLRLVLLWASNNLYVRI